ncbi:uncharacterized protein ank2a isoform X2 [Stigmatopora argus]
MSGLVSMLQTEMDQTVESSLVTDELLKDEIIEDTSEQIILMKKIGREAHLLSCDEFGFGTEPQIFEEHEKIKDKIKTPHSSLGNDDEELLVATQENSIHEDITTDEPQLEKVYNDRETADQAPTPLKNVSGLVSLLQTQMGQSPVYSPVTDEMVQEENNEDTLEQIILMKTIERETHPISCDESGSGTEPQNFEEHEKIEDRIKTPHSSLGNDDEELLVATQENSVYEDITTDETQLEKVYNDRETADQTPTPLKNMSGLVSLLQTEKDQSPVYSSVTDEMVQEEINEDTLEQIILMKTIERETHPISCDESGSGTEPQHFEEHEKIEDKIKTPHSSLGNDDEELLVATQENSIHEDITTDEPQLEKVYNDRETADQAPTPLKNVSGLVSLLQTQMGQSPVYSPVTDEMVQEENNEDTLEQIILMKTIERETHPISCDESGSGTEPQNFEEHEKIEDRIKTPHSSLGNDDEELLVATQENSVYEDITTDETQLEKVYNDRETADQTPTPLKNVSGLVSLLQTEKDQSPVYSSVTDEMVQEEINEDTLEQIILMKTIERETHPISCDESGSGTEHQHFEEHEKIEDKIKTPHSSLGNDDEELLVATQENSVYEDITTDETQLEKVYNDRETADQTPTPLKNVSGLVSLLQTEMDQSPVYSPVTDEMVQEEINEDTLEQIILMKTIERESHPISCDESGSGTEPQHFEEHEKIEDRIKTPHSSLGDDNEELLVATQENSVYEDIATDEPQLEKVYNDRETADQVPTPLKNVSGLVSLLQTQMDQSPVYNSVTDEMVQEEINEDNLEQIILMKTIEKETHPLSCDESGSGTEQTHFEELDKFENKNKTPHSSLGNDYEGLLVAPQLDNYNEEITMAEPLLKEFHIGEKTNNQGSTAVKDMSGLVSIMKNEMDQSLECTIVTDQVLQEDIIIDNFEQIILTNGKEKDVLSFTSEDECGTGQNNSEEHDENEDENKTPCSNLGNEFDVPLVGQQMNSDNEDISTDEPRPEEIYIVRKTDKHFTTAIENMSGLVSIMKNEMDHSLEFSPVTEQLLQEDIIEDNFEQVILTKGKEKDFLPFTSDNARFDTKQKLFEDYDEFKNENMVPSCSSGNDYEGYLVSPQVNNNDKEITMDEPQIEEVCDNKANNQGPAGEKDMSGLVSTMKRDMEQYLKSSPVTEQLQHEDIFEEKCKQIIQTKGGEKIVHPFTSDKTGFCTEQKDFEQKDIQTEISKTPCSSLDDDYDRLLVTPQTYNDNGVFKTDDSLLEEGNSGRTLETPTPTGVTSRAGLTFLIKNDLMQNSDMRSPPDQAQHEHILEEDFDQFITTNENMKGTYPFASNEIVLNTEKPQSNLGDDHGELAVEHITIDQSQCEEVRFCTNVDYQAPSAVRDMSGLVSIMKNDLEDEFEHCRVSPQMKNENDEYKVYEPQLEEVHVGTKTKIQTTTKPQDMSGLVSLLKNGLDQCLETRFVPSELHEDDIIEEIFEEVTLTKATAKEIGPVASNKCEFGRELKHFDESVGRQDNNRTCPYRLEVDLEGLPASHQINSDERMNDEITIDEEQEHKEVHISKKFEDKVVVGNKDADHAKMEDCSFEIKTVKDTENEWKKSPNPEDISGTLTAGLSNLNKISVEEEEENYFYEQEEGDIQDGMTHEDRRPAIIKEFTMTEELIEQQTSYKLSTDGMEASGMMSLLTNDLDQCLLDWPVTHQTPEEEDIIEKQVEQVFLTRDQNSLSEEKDKKLEKQDEETLPQMQTSVVKVKEESPSSVSEAPFQEIYTDDNTCRVQSKTERDFSGMLSLLGCDLDHHLKEEPVLTECYPADGEVHESFKQTKVSKNIDRESCASPENSTMLSNDAISKQSKCKTYLQEDERCENVLSKEAASKMYSPDDSNFSDHSDRIGNFTKTYETMGECNNEYKDTYFGNSRPQRPADLKKLDTVIFNEPVKELSPQDSLEGSPILEDMSSKKSPDSIEPSPTRESPCADSLEGSPTHLEDNRKMIFSAKGESYDTNICEKDLQSEDHTSMHTSKVNQVTPEEEMFKMAARIKTFDEMEQDAKTKTDTFPYTPSQTSDVHVEQTVPAVIPSLRDTPENYEPKSVEGRDIGLSLHMEMVQSELQKQTEDIFKRSEESPLINSKCQFANESNSNSCTDETHFYSFVTEEMYPENDNDNLLQGPSQEPKYFTPRGDHSVTHTGPDEEQENYYDQAKDNTTFDKSPDQSPSDDKTPDQFQFEEGKLFEMTRGGAIDLTRSVSEDVEGYAFFQIKQHPVDYVVIETTGQEHSTLSKCNNSDSIVEDSLEKTTELHIPIPKPRTLISTSCEKSKSDKELSEVDLGSSTDVQLGSPTGLDKLNLHQENDNSLHSTIDDLQSGTKESCDLLFSSADEDDEEDQCSIIEMPFSSPFRDVTQCSQTEKDSHLKLGASPENLESVMVNESVDPTMVRRTRSETGDDQSKASSKISRSCSDSAQPTYESNLSSVKPLPSTKQMKEIVICKNDASSISLDTDDISSSSHKSPDSVIFNYDIPTSSSLDLDPLTAVQPSSGTADVFESRPIWDDTVETQMERLTDESSPQSMAVDWQDDADRKDEALAIIADLLGFSWTELARELEFNEDEIQFIRSHNPNSLQEQSHALLQRWVEREGKHATEDCLIKKLTKINRMDIVHLIETQMNKSIQEQTSRTYAEIEKTLDHSEVSMGLSSVQDDVDSPRIVRRIESDRKPPPAVSEEDLSVASLLDIPSWAEPAGHTHSESVHGDLLEELDISHELNPNLWISDDVIAHEHRSNVNLDEHVATSSSEANIYKPKENKDPDFECFMANVPSMHRSINTHSENVDLSTIDTLYQNKNQSDITIISETVSPQSTDEKSLVFPDQSEEFSSITKDLISSEEEIVTSSKSSPTPPGSRSQFDYFPSDLEEIKVTQEDTSSEGDHIYGYKNIQLERGHSIDTTIQQEQDKNQTIEQVHTFDRVVSKGVPVDAAIMPSTLGGDTNVSPTENMSSANICSGLHSVDSDTELYFDCRQDASDFSETEADAPKLRLSSNKDEDDHCPNCPKERENVPRKVVLPSGSENYEKVFVVEKVGPIESDDVLSDSESSAEEITSCPLHRSKITAYDATNSLTRADEMPDLPTQTVTEETYKDENGHIVIRKVSRKIIRKCVSEDGTEREEVSIVGSPQRSISVAEGDGYSKVVKRTVLKSDGDHTEVTFAECAGISASQETMELRNVSLAERTTVVEGKRTVTHKGDMSLATDLPSAQDDFQQALGYLGEFTRAELPHVVESETVKDDGTVIRRAHMRKGQTLRRTVVQGAGQRNQVLLEQVDRSEKGSKPHELQQHLHQLFHYYYKEHQEDQDEANEDEEEKQQRNG